MYFLLRLIVTACLLLNLLRGQYERVLICVLSLVLFLLPALLAQALQLELPDPLEIGLLLFIFAAEIPGELGGYYLRLPHWDTMLHSVSGFLTAAIGFAAVHLLNCSDHEPSPLLCAVFAFCFSMTIGILWEFFEFAMDVCFRTDMQKDTILSAISATLPGSSAMRFTGIREVTVNGQLFCSSGYPDIGLYDTMGDLMVSFAGAALFCTIGYVHLRFEDKGRLARRFIPVIHPCREDKTSGR